MREISTDGSCIGNPGPGGRAVIGERRIGDQEKGEKIVFSGSEALTTNNQMELQAVIEALEGIGRREEKGEKKQQVSGGVGLFATEPEAQIEEEIHIRTDSNYVKLGVTERLPTWKRRNRRHTRGGKLIENLDRRQRLDQLLDIFTNLHRHRVKGHAGDKMNERVDELARKEAERGVKN